MPTEYQKMLAAKRVKQALKYFLLHQYPGEPAELTDPECAAEVDSLVDDLVEAASPTTEPQNIVEALEQCHPDGCFPAMTKTVEEGVRERSWLETLCTALVGAKVGRWTASYEYPGFVQLSSDEEPGTCVMATPEWEGYNLLPMQISTEAGHADGICEVRVNWAHDTNIARQQWIDAVKEQEHEIETAVTEVRGANQIDLLFDMLRNDDRFDGYFQLSMDRLGGNLRGITIKINDDLCPYLGYVLCTNHDGPLVISSYADDEADVPTLTLYEGYSVPSAVETLARFLDNDLDNER